MSYTISAHGSIWDVQGAYADFEASGNLFPTIEAAEEELARRIAVWNEKYNPPTKQMSVAFEVKLHDEPRTYTWHEAMKAFDNNPDSQWRLPTHLELAVMYQKREEIGGITSDDYWSSSEHGSYGVSWSTQFSDGAHFYINKNNSYALRLLRKEQQ